MLKIVLSCIFQFFLFSSVFAANDITLFKKPFSLSGAKICRGHVIKCIKKGPYPDPKCTDEVLNKFDVCKQTKILSKAVNMNPGMVAVKQFGEYYLVRVNFVADGQQQYYILTPKGRLINTLLRPKNLDKDKTLVLGDGAPVMKKVKKDGVLFSVPLVVKEGCVACKTLEKINAVFDFDAEGKLLNKSTQRRK